ncbi:hypothetical protein CIJ70_01675 [Neisseria meningitidis]|uniref:Uncharacterized protein n=2 Tax=Neisseria meningitidis TaxID=487 RepID=C6SLN8_NEIME|nr:hypothetical protein [Neisseria meningitidis]CBA09197.1 hypothetical protein NMW_1864 [Neisseria meningitidis alpha275]MBG8972557.1 hypothetical protein [Neisseria meningitidis]RGA50041.1 hypothetical protein CIJ82_03005 [Neisseria meningitidis]RGA58941.1 hypothetical protein CIJ77_01660 [Neisseria meningitidis]RGA60730.1 hypothetical protein CIJ75_03775 [Neisseria meningitidis]
MLIHYINSANLSEKQLMRQCLVHVCFLISAIATAWTDKIVYSTIHKPHWGFYYKKTPDKPACRVFNYVYFKPLRLFRQENHAVSA